MDVEPDELLFLCGFALFSVTDYVLSAMNIAAIVGTEINPFYMFFGLPLAILKIGTLVIVGAMYFYPQITDKFRYYVLGAGLATAIIGTWSNIAVHLI